MDPLCASVSLLCKTRIEQHLRGLLRGLTRVIAKPSGVQGWRGTRSESQNTPLRGVCGAANAPSQGGSHSRPALVPAPGVSGRVSGNTRPPPDAVPAGTHVTGPELPSSSWPAPPPPPPASAQISTQRRDSSLGRGLRDAPATTELFRLCVPPPSFFCNSNPTQWLGKAD